MKKLLTTLAAIVLFAGAAFAQPGSTNPVIPGGGSGGTGTIGGSTGATDDKLLCSDGVGGSTLGVCTVADIDNLRLDGNTISSTNTNGDINLVPNGTGQVLMPVGSVAKPGWGFTGDSDTGISGNGSNFILFSTAGVQRAYLYSGGLNIEPSLQFMASLDIGWARDAAGIWRASDASTGLGWVKENGKFALGSDFTSLSATPANLTGLTATLKSGRKYFFRMALRFSDSTAADGARFDFDGGTATATDFGVNCLVYDSTLLHVIDTTALATDLVATTTTGASSIKCDGSFTVNAAGTFIPRAGQEAASGGTLTVETGSYLDITDASFN